MTARGLAPPAMVVAMPRDVIRQRDEPGQRTVPMTEEHRW
jgi:hypothetical protein